MAFTMRCWAVRHRRPRRVYTRAMTGAPFHKSFAAMAVLLLLVGGGRAHAADEEPATELEGEPGARELPLPAPWPEAAGLHPAEPGWQRLPGEGGGDGFYYALLGRAAMAPVPGLH